ncbi:unnamed protein product [Effrenium voratum]|uniref:Uncharacterized protein n=1 Tax=Effrenium voratum TaxID=2562239 RepID=A0AA36NAN7_9DINO|nr:unnamed protein product [Effrenium voratum]CAJ1457533.1 unnamed protein product [Effrenium voratum]
MASLAEFPEAVEALFRQRELASDGRCQVQLHDSHGRSVALAVDEFIPCHIREWWDDEGMPLFARPNGNEAWVLLLEKAFAKMLGSYTALSGGNCCSAFRAFTGEQSFVWARSEGETARVEGEWKKMQLASGEDYFMWTPGTEERRDASSLWEEVRSYDRQSFLVACSMRARHGQEHIREDGLVEAHAYSLLHAVDVEGQRLVFLRNPWGNDKRWNGRWCDGDEAWAQYPGLRRRLRPQFRNDGAFWMAWIDFQASFDFVYVCAKRMRSAADASEHARRSEMGEVPEPAPAPAARRRRIARALPERLPRLPPGARVELMGHDLEGCVFEVVGWDEEAGKYQLRSVPPSHWTCPKCGEVNKRARSSCNVCGGERDALVPGATSRNLHVRPEYLVLPAGTEVALDGLRDFPELNGQEGTIVAFDALTGRYHVRLGDGGVRAIRPPHVVARKPPSKEQEFGRWSPPDPEPSPVDEPEPPEEAAMDNEDDFDRLAEALDEQLQLQRDVQAADGRWNLRRGQQLVREGIKPLLVERCAIACAASGHAGGFLARGWGSGATEALHHQGFDLHEKLAKELDIRSYRRLPTLSVGGKLRRDVKDRFPWVDRAGAEMMDQETAQVNPAEVTSKLMDAALALGAKLRLGKVEGVKKEEDQVTAVLVDGEAVHCKKLIFAMGPWSVLLEQWMPEVKVPMEGVLSSSLLFQVPRPIEPCALFCAEDDFHCHLEVNPRNDGTVYVCGLGGSTYLKELDIAKLPPEMVKPNPARVTAATKSLRAKTSLVDDLEPSPAACIRPCPPDARPMIGKAYGNVFLACGHNCWGILWGPITGQIMAELATGGSPSVPLAAFDPQRFLPRAVKRGRHMREQPVGEQW